MESKIRIDHDYVTDETFIRIDHYDGDLADKTLKHFLESVNARGVTLEYRDRDISKGKAQFAVLRPFNENELNLLTLRRFIQMTEEAGFTRDHWPEDCIGSVIATLKGHFGFTEKDLS